MTISSINSVNCFFSIFKVSCSTDYHSRVIKSQYLQKPFMQKAQKTNQLKTEQKLSSVPLLTLINVCTRIEKTFLIFIK